MTVFVMQVRHEKQERIVTVHDNKVSASLLIVIVKHYVFFAFPEI